MTAHLLDDQAKTETVDICKETASSLKIVAASIHDLHLSGYVERKSDVNVLLILDSPRLTLKHQLKHMKDATFSILAVDQKTFEKDVAGDWLGGLLVENMLVPYEPLVNETYLWDQEVKAKKRIIIEILNNLTLEYPEMSSELLIKPEYFMYEAMARKASLYPPMTYKFLNILSSDSGLENRELMIKGFKTAIDAVSKDGLVAYSGEYVKITRNYLSAFQRRRFQALNLLKVVRSSILRHSFEVFPKMMRSLIEDYRTYTKHFLEIDDSSEILPPELEDPKRCVFISTSLGPVSLSDRPTIEDFVKRTVPNAPNTEIDLERLGGVLNAVYIICLHRDKEEQKIIVKIFKDWYGWKWFPLALWALGTRGFAVLGKSRLEREYAINRLLSSQGINVPRIIYVSPKERLIFQEYIEGENLVKIIKQICSSKKVSSELSMDVRQVGREIAKVHKLDVALGDCKPENIIITKEGTVYFVDLEQAERGGDQAWDIAELLYFSGHYSSISSIEAIQIITKEFVYSYLESDGKAENIRKARSPRYIKVFSFFTPPHIIFAISNTCQEILRKKKVG